MKKTKPLRPAFVAVVATMTTMGLGCSAPNEAPSASLVGPVAPSIHTNELSGDGGTEANGCPSAMPERFGLCANTGLVCVYDSTSKAYVGQDETCDVDAGFYPTKMECHETWQQTDICTSNPPPPCPDSPPALGSDCTYNPIIFDTPTCGYRSRCVASADDAGTVVDTMACLKVEAPDSGATDLPHHRWNAQRKSALIACPTEAPVEGANCSECAAHYPPTCTYDAGAASCGEATGTWSYGVDAGGNGGTPDGSGASGASAGEDSSSCAAGPRTHGSFGAFGLLGAVVILSTRRRRR